MYKCQLCHRTVPPKTKAYRIVVETRAREYPARKKVNRYRVEGHEFTVDDPGGAGYEIARELTVCPDCMTQHQSVAHSEKTRR